MTELDNEAHKFIVAGLDEAGKTSILNVLDRKYNLQDKIKPTVGFNRSIIRIMGVPIINFDLGGQERYRESYFQDLKLFEQTDVLFFVIDALDVKRHPEAVQYYKRLLKVYKAFDIKPRLVVCVHKIDPNIRNSPQVAVAIEEIRELFQEISKGFEVSVFITSIYDQKSIVQAFSKNIQELIPTLKPIKDLLTSFVRIQRLNGAMLFDENMMILSGFFLSAELEQVCLETVYNSTFYLKNVNPDMCGDFSSNFELILDFQNQEKRFNFIESCWKDWKFYLLTMGQDRISSETINKKFSALLNTL